MPRRTDFQRAITYTGQAIKGAVEISYKIDGVRLLSRGGEIVTRNDKIPPGLLKACSTEAIQKMKVLGDCELYTGEFKDVQGPISRYEPDPNIFTEDNVYSLVDLDERLLIDYTYDLEKDSQYIQGLLKRAVEAGYEGLVLRTYNEDGTTKKWYRVKPNHTADVFVTGYFEQVDKNKVPKGQLGGFETNYGKVTAFSEELRKKLWKKPEQYVGKLIQVTYKELYDTGSFRYCVTFNHLRYDKDIESFDTENT